jgi:large subunit ribosomal protein L31e
MVTERVYTIPLRKGFKDVARYKKTKRAVAVLREFLAKHMRTDLSKVYVGKNLNKELWKHGIKNPPGKIKVVVIKEDNGDVKAELFGFKYEHKKKEQKESEKESKKDSKKDSKIEEKAKEAKKRVLAEEKHEHTHEEGHEHAHNPEEKHEHAASHTHEHPKSTKLSKPTKMNSE